MKTQLKYPGLDHQPDQAEKRGWGLSTLKRFLRFQFGQPTGLFGRVAGYLMAANRSNHERLEWTISLLDIQPGDQVLEVGFGPGFGIQQASGFATEGFVAGVDHSDVMVRQAAKRNARAVREGRVELRQGSASDPPSFTRHFDKIFTINSIHFWEEPVECLKKLRTQLAPGGLMAVTLQPRSRTATDESAATLGKELAGKLEAAGFSDVEVKIKTMEPVAAACVLGRNPGGTPAGRGEG